MPGGGAGKFGELAQGEGGARSGSRHIAREISAWLQYAEFKEAADAAGNVDALPFFRHAHQPRIQMHSACKPQPLSTDRMPLR